MKSIFNVLSIALMALPCLINPASGKDVRVQPNETHQHARLAAYTGRALQKPVYHKKTVGEVHDDLNRRVHIMPVQNEARLGRHWKRDEGNKENEPEKELKDIGNAKGESKVNEIDEKVEEMDSDVDEIKETVAEMEDNVNGIKEILEEDEGLLEELIEKAVDKSLGVDLRDAFPSFRERLHDRCIEPSASDVYFHVTDPKDMEYVLYSDLVAIRTPWKANYPSRLRAAARKAGYTVIDHHATDIWTSLPWEGRMSSKRMGHHHGSLFDTTHCSWREVDSVAAAGVFRGRVSYWSGGALINQTQAEAFGISTTAFKWNKDPSAALDWNTTVMEFERVDDDDLLEIHKMLVETYPTVEITAIVVGTISPIVIGLVCWRLLTPRVKSFSRKKSKADDRQKVLGGHELGTLTPSTPAPQYSRSTNTLNDDERVIEPWRAV